MSINNKGREMKISVAILLLSNIVNGMIPQNSNENSIIKYTLDGVPPQQFSLIQNSETLTIDWTTAHWINFSKRTYKGIDMHKDLKISSEMSKEEIIKNLQEVFQKKVIIEKISDK